MLRNGKKIKRAKILNLLMKISLFLSSLLFYSISNAAIIPQGFKSLLMSTPTFSESLGAKIYAESPKTDLLNSTFKVSALENWKSISPILSGEYTQNSRGILISSRLLRNGTIADLRIKGANFEIPFNPNNNKCFLPINTKTMVIFNQSQSMVMDNEKLTAEIPFDFNGNYNLMDYNLLIPFQFFKDSKITQEQLGGYLEANKMDVLFYNSALEIRLPFLVIMISKIDGDPIFPNNSGEGNKTTNQNEQTPTNLSSLVFDMLSKNWLGSQNSVNLMKSIFCIMNNELVSNNSICFNLNDQSVSFFPAFKSQGGFNFETLQNKKVKRSYIGTTKSKLFNSTHPFSVQLGNANLDHNTQKFTNLTKCKDQGKYNKQIVPLKGSLINPTEHYSEEMYQLRSSKNTQVFQLLKRESGDQCDPVTWFNVFHRSLFGSKVEFCKD